MDIVDHEKLSINDEEKLEIIRENLRTARECAHLRQREVARKIGVKQTTVSNWELGRSQPDFLSLLKLFELYQVQPGDILSGQPLKFTPFSENSATEQSDPRSPLQPPDLALDHAITEQENPAEPVKGYQYPTSHSEENLLTVAQPSPHYRSATDTLSEISGNCRLFDDPALARFEYYQFSPGEKKLQDQELFLTRAMDDNMTGDHITPGTLLLCKKITSNQAGKSILRNGSLVLLSLDGQPAIIRRIHASAEGVMLSASSRHTLPSFIAYEDRQTQTLPASIQLKAAILYVMIDVL